MKLVFVTFGIFFFNKGQSAIPPHLNFPEVFSPASGKVKLCVKVLPENSSFNDSGSSLPGFPSNINVKYCFCNS